MQIDRPRCAYAGQPTHPLVETHRAIRVQLLHPRPVIKHLVQLLAVDLDPLAAQRDQAAGGSLDLGDLVRCQSFTIHAHRHLEGKHRPNAQGFLLLCINRHLDHRARRLAALPPVWHLHDNAALLEHLEVTD